MRGFFLVLLLVLVQTAAAEPLLLGTDARMRTPALAAAVLEDRSGELRIEDVKLREDFRAALPAEANGFNFGYSASAWWLRLDLQGGAGEPGDWLLNVGFPLLDRIEYYGPTGERVVTGDTLPFTTRPVEDRDFVFPLKVGAGETARIYLRISSEGTMSVPLRLSRPADFMTETRDDYALQALYFGMLLALILYNLLLFVSLRDRAFLLYVFFASGMALGQLTFTGLAAQWLWPGSPAWGNVANIVGFAVTGVFGMFFMRALFDTPRTMRRLDGALLAFAAVFGLCALAVPVLPYRFVSVQLSLAGAAAMLLILAVALRAGQLGLPGVRWVMAAGACLAAGVGTYVLRNFDMLPANFLTLYSFQIAAAVEMLLLTVVLGERVTAVLRETLVRQEGTLAQRQDQMDGLRQQEVELQRRIAERTLQLDQSNARLRQSEEMLSSVAHTDTLTGLANRHLLEARLAQTQQLAVRGEHRYALMLLNLDGFKGINNRFGHAIGDELLRQVADRLRAAVRAVDTVARLGADEFVVVVGDIAGPPNAESVAGKLVAELGRSYRLVGIELESGASLGLVIAEGTSLTLAELMRRADYAMHAAKEAGGGRWRMAAA